MNAPNKRLPAGYSDETGPRIIAFLHAVRPNRGVAGIGDTDEYQRGRNTIERLAWSARGCETPPLLLNHEQCADVCHFLARSEPLAPAVWYDEPADAPSHLVGLQFILEALEDSLRRYVEPAEGLEAKRQRVARTIQLAIEQAEEVRQDADEGSDVEAEAQDALDHLRPALDYFALPPEREAEEDAQS